MATGKKVCLLGGLLFAIFLFGIDAPSRLVRAQETAPAAGSKAAERAPAKDYYQRSLRIYEFRKAAERGQERGREIFYYKCWYCHNEFAKGAPQLKGLYSRPQLISGQPVNDETVKAKIRNGGQGMPRFGTTLSEDDLTDIVTFVRDACCWNSEAPPANPSFRMPE